MEIGSGGGHSAICMGTPSFSVHSPRIGSRISGPRVQGPWCSCQGSRFSPSFRFAINVIKFWDHTPSSWTSSYIRVTMDVSNFELHDPESQTFRHLDAYAISHARTSGIEESLESLLENSITPQAAPWIAQKKIWEQKFNLRTNV